MGAQQKIASPSFLKEKKKSKLYIKTRCLFVHVVLTKVALGVISRWSRLRHVKKWPFFCCCPCCRNFFAWPTWLAKTSGSSARNIKSTSGEDTVWTAIQPLMSCLKTHCNKKKDSFIRLSLNRTATFDIYIDLLYIKSKSSWLVNPDGRLPLCRNIATIAVFYALPVIQLVITYQTVS